MPIFTETATLMSDGTTVTHVSATAPDGREHGGVYTSPEQRDALIAQLTEQIEATIKTQVADFEASLRAAVAPIVSLVAAPLGSGQTAPDYAEMSIDLRDAVPETYPAGERSKDYFVGMNSK